MCVRIVQAALYRRLHSGVWRSSGLDGIVVASFSQRGKEDERMGIVGAHCQRDGGDDPTFRAGNWARPGPALEKLV